MFVIADEDIDKVQEVVTRTMRILNKGIGRVDLLVDTGDGLDSMVVTGYWVVDTIRINIRIKK